jgi:hypothetical protein
MRERFGNMCPPVPPPVTAIAVVAVFTAAVHVAALFISHLLSTLPN